MSAASVNAAMKCTSTGHGSSHVMALRPLDEATVAPLNPGLTIANLRRDIVAFAYSVSTA
jgi:hypothetical protein